MYVWVACLCPLPVLFIYLFIYLFICLFIGCVGSKLRHMGSFIEALGFSLVVARRLQSAWAL